MIKTKRWRETLPNGVSHETLDCVDNGFYDNTNVYTVPSGRLFLLGDNRDNSTDSRVLSAIGYVPLENIRAAMIFFSVGRDPAGAGIKETVRANRFDGALISGSAAFARCCCGSRNWSRWSGWWRRSAASTFMRVKGRVLMPCSPSWFA